MERSNKSDRNSDKNRYNKRNGLWLRFDVRISRHDGLSHFPERGQEALDLMAALLQIDERSDPQIAE
jgi:hypothetical protein